MKRLASILSWFTYLLLIVKHLFHEEEVQAAYYRSTQIPRELDELTAWWNEFEALYKYPLYCIILASGENTEIAGLVQENQPELAELSGRECCFIYFRNMDQAKDLAPYQYKEHSAWVNPLASLLGIKQKRLPILLFFEHLVSGKYVTISLDQKSKAEILSMVGEIFDYLRSSKKEKLFSALKNYKLAQKVSLTRNTLTRKVGEIGSMVIGEMIRSMMAYTTTSIFR